jgi:flagellar FliL protein
MPSALGTRLSLRELAIVVLLGVVVGATFEAIRPNLANEANHAVPVAQPPETSSLYDLPPIVTNLGSPQETWIRLEGSIIFDPKRLPHPEAVAGEIGDDILAYLRTVTLKQLEGRSDFRTSVRISRSARRRAPAGWCANSSFEPW